MLYVAPLGISCDEVQAGPLFRHILWEFQLIWKQRHDWGSMVMKVQAGDTYVFQDKANWGDLNCKLPVF